MHLFLFRGGFRYQQNPGHIHPRHKLCFDDGASTHQQPSLQAAALPPRTVGWHCVPRLQYHLLLRWRSWAVS